jgi:cell division protein FtsB
VAVNADVVYQQKQLEQAEKELQQLKVENEKLRSERVKVSDVMNIFLKYQGQRRSRCK